MLEFWGFRSGVAEGSIRLGYDAAAMGNQIRMFPRYVGIWLTSDTATYPRGMKS